MVFACPFQQPLVLMRRTLFPPTKWSCQLNAAIAALCFYWLVGEAERRSADVEVAPGKVVNMKSVVHIKKCRYLEASGCVGLCVNMCKVGGWVVVMTT